MKGHNIEVAEELIDDLRQRRATQVADLLRTTAVKVTVDGFHPPRFPEYQKKGVVLPFIQPRCLVGDGVGLGKMIMALGFLCLAKARGKAKPPYLVLTTAASLDQWAEHTSRFTDLSYVKVRGEKQERISQYQEGYSHDVILLPYETVRHDYHRVPWLTPQIVLADEATTFKNFESKTFEAVQQFSQTATYFVAYTATPLQNSLDELWSVFHIVDPEIFGDHGVFRARYCKEEHFKVRTKWGFKKLSKVVGYRNLTEARRRIAPYYIRRTREDIPVEDRLPMPEAYSSERWLEMTAAQREKYRELAETKGGTRLERMTRILQCCDTLANFPELGKEDSPKVDEVMTLLEGELKGTKAVIFSRFKKPLYQLYQRLNKAGIQYADLTGDVELKTGEREANRQRFWNDPDCLVATITTSGEMSLNLQCAQVMIQMNQLYNPARMDQVVGRVYRSFSVHDRIFVIRLFMYDSLEEKVIKVLEEKRELFAGIFGADEVFSLLTEEEFNSLI